MTRLKDLMLESAEKIALTREPGKESQVKIAAINDAINAARAEKLPLEDRKAKVRQERAGQMAAGILITVGGAARSAKDDKLGAEIAEIDKGLREIDERIELLRQARGIEGEKLSAANAPFQEAVAAAEKLAVAELAGEARQLRDLYAGHIRRVIAVRTIFRRSVFIDAQHKIELPDPSRLGGALLRNGVVIDTEGGASKIVEDLKTSWASDPDIVAFREVLEPLLDGYISSDAINAANRIPRTA